MTVRELIKKLSEFPDDLTVVDYEYNMIRDVFKVRFDFDETVAMIN